MGADTELQEAEAAEDRFGAFYLAEEFGRHPRCHTGCETRDRPKRPVPGWQAGEPRELANFVLAKTYIKQGS